MPIEKDLLEKIKKDDSHLIKLDFVGSLLIKEDLDELESAIKNNNFIRQIEWGSQDVSSISIINEINGYLKKNVEKYTQQKAHCTKHAEKYRERPSDYEYAMLSEHVYEDVQPGSVVSWKRADNVQKELPGWKVHKVFEDKKNGYYGVAYIQEEEEFLVLAHRGSELSFFSLLYSDYAKDLRTDIDILYNHITGQQVSAYVAAKEMVELAITSNWQFSTTGHSLGGWLAQVTLIHCHKDFNYEEANAVTFDNPGAQNMLKSLEKGAAGGYKIKESTFDAITYVVSPNLVNVNGELLGSARQLSPKVKNFSKELNELQEIVKEMLGKYLPKKLVESSVERLFEKLSKSEIAIINWLQTVAQHSIDGIVDCFDPISGAPKEQMIVEHWPLVTWYKENKMLDGLIEGSINELVRKETFKSDSIPQPISDWVRKYTTKKISKELLKALEGILDLQFVRTVDLFLNYYSGGVDKENYIEFLKFANEKNNYVPNPLSIKERYVLNYKAQYKTTDYSEHVLSVRHFRPKIRRHLKAKSKEIDCAVHGMCDSNMIRLPEKIKFSNRQSDVLIDTSHLLNNNNAFWFRQYMTCLDKTSLLGPLPAITKFTDWREDLIEYYKRKFGIWRDVFDRRTLDIDNTYIMPSIFSLKEQERSKKILLENVIAAPMPGNNLGQQKAFIIGKPGMGKTLFLKYIAYQWANGQLWNEFRWIFFIELRNLRENKYKNNIELSWLDVVAQEIFQKTLTQEDKNFLNNFFEKDLRDGRVLFLFDGYDEIVSEDDLNENRHVRKLFDDLFKQNYLLTSRLDIEKTSVRFSEFKYINRFEIGEFNVQESNTYIENFFINEKEKAGRLEAFLTTNFFVKKQAFHLANIPLNLEILCVLWENVELNGNVKPTLTELYDKLLKRFMIREYAKYSKTYTEADVEEYFSKKLPALPVLSRIAYRMLENNNQVAMKTKQIREILKNELFIEDDKIALSIERMQNLGFLKPHRSDDDRDSVGHSQEFRHEMFRNFFAAKHIATLFEKNIPEGVSILNKYKHTPHFEMTFIFTIGLLATHATHATDASLLSFLNEFLLGESVDLFGVRNRLMMVPYLEEIRGKQTLPQEQINWVFDISKTNQLDALANFASALENTYFINDYPKIIELMLAQLKLRNVQKSINAIRILNALKDNFQENNVVAGIGEAISELLMEPHFLKMRADKTIEFFASFVPFLSYLLPKIKEKELIDKIKKCLIDISSNTDCNYFMRRFSEKSLTAYQNEVCKEGGEGKYFEKLFDLFISGKLMELDDFIILINNKNFEIKIVTFTAITWYIHNHAFNEDQLFSLLKEMKKFLICEESFDENREVLFWCSSAIVSLSGRVSPVRFQELLKELKNIVKEEKYLKISIFVIDILGRFFMDEKFGLSELEKIDIANIIYAHFQNQKPEQCSFMNGALYHPYSGGLILPAETSFEHLKKTADPSECYQAALHRYLCNALRDAGTHQRDKYVISYHDETGKNKDFSFRDWDSSIPFWDDKRLPIVHKIISECGYHTPKPKEISKKSPSSTPSIHVEAAFLLNEEIEDNVLFARHEDLNVVLGARQLEIENTNQKYDGYLGLTSRCDEFIYRKLESAYLRLIDRPIYLEEDVRKKFDLEFSILQSVAFYLVTHEVDEINNQMFLKIIKDNIQDRKSSIKPEDMLTSLKGLDFFEFSDSGLIKFSGQGFNLTEIKEFLTGNYVNNLFLGVNTRQHQLIDNLHVHYLLSNTRIWNSILEKQLSIGTVKNQDTKTFPFDYGAWDPNIRYHLQTGEPIFTYHVYKDGERVGNASFYKHPLICRSEDGTRHNVIELTGVLSQYDIDKKINEVNEICEGLPPTFLEQTISTISYAGQHGFVRGLSNTVGYTCKSIGASAWMETMAMESFYYVLFFVMHYTYYSYQLEKEQAITEPSSVSFYQAARDTGYLLLSNVIIQGARKVSAHFAQRTIQNGWQQTGRVLGLFERYAGCLKYTYDIYNHGAIQMGTGIVAGSISEKVAEAAGNKIVDFGFAYRLHQKARREAEEAARTEAEEIQAEEQGGGLLYGFGGHQRDRKRDNEPTENKAIGRREALSQTKMKIEGEEESRRTRSSVLNREPLKRPRGR